MILQLRLLIAAHTGPGGHHGITTTEQAMNGFLHWTSMRKDLASFCELLHPLLEYFNWRNCAKINGVIATCCDAKQAASIWLPSHLTWTEGRPIHFRPLSRSFVLLPLSYLLLRPTLRLQPLLVSTGLRVSLSYWTGSQTAGLISETLSYACCMSRIIHPIVSIWHTARGATVQSKLGIAKSSVSLVPWIL
jgi:hypothetical protein